VRDPGFGLKLKIGIVINLSFLFMEYSLKLLFYCLVRTNLKDRAEINFFDPTSFVLKELLALQRSHRIKMMVTSKKIDNNDTESLFM
jgi:hypothetical protein